MLQVNSDQGGDLVLKIEEQKHLAEDAQHDNNEDDKKSDGVKRKQEVMESLIKFIG